MQGHLPALYGWTRILRPDWIIELGVRTGISTTAFLAALDHNRKGRLWSCDMDWPQIRIEIRDHPRWQFAVGDDRYPDLLDPPPPDSCGLLFIDTSHEFAHTRRELEQYAPRVQAGGIILAHDVDDPDCGRAVREWVGPRPYSYGLGACRV